MTFKPKYSKIKGLSERLRLPRLGAIRLGLKVEKTFGKSYPKEVDYFVCPPEVIAVYGPEPKELDIMLPLDDREAIFPQSYKLYGSQRGLKCQGDGETAHQVMEDGVMEERTCPCELLEEGDCKQIGILRFMLPLVDMGGVYQITTSSYNSIIDINSGLAFIEALLGTIKMKHLKLRRREIFTYHGDRKQTHYTLQVAYQGTLKDLIDQSRSGPDKAVYELEEPDETDPKLGPPDAGENDSGIVEFITEAQIRKLRMLIDQQDLSDVEKEECYQWIKQGAETVRVVADPKKYPDGFRLVITKESAVAIIKNFDAIFDRFIDYKIQAGSGTSETEQQ